MDPLEIRLARVFSRRLSGREVLIPTTHQQLADELGTAREVISRALERWQSDGWVRLRRGTVEILQPGAIQRTAGPS